MTVYMTEQQQLEQLHQWWKKYGVSSVVVILLALIFSVGLHFWLQHREVKRERASGHYEELLNAVVNNDAPNAIKEATLLTENYESTPYAALAALVLARSDVYQQNYSDAEKRLTWVANHASTSSLRQVARIRLARVLLQQQQPEQALKVLKKINDKSYLVVIDEVKGDSYVQLKQYAEAQELYQQAITMMPGYAQARPILQMKLDNLPQH